MNIQTLFMSYDVYERHAVISQLLRQVASEGDDANMSVLDIGGWTDLLERFLPYHIVSINPDGSGHVIGDGCALPVVDNAVDAVVSIDTLEHLPKEERLIFLSECLRVARKWVIIAAPFGSAGHSANERRLNELYFDTSGQIHAYLSEHVEFGLPGKGELDYFEQNLSAKNVQRFYAGDYVWQGKCFERMIVASRKPAILKRFLNLYNYIISLAIFHPIKLHTVPNETTNRFYLRFEKP